MKKIIWKKVIAMIMVLTMVIGIIGCGKEGGDGEDSKEKKNVNNKDMVYEVSDFTINGIEGEPSNFFVRDGKLYFQTYQRIEEETVKDGKVKQIHGTDEKEDTASADVDLGTEEGEQSLAQTIESKMNINSDQAAYDSKVVDVGNGIASDITNEEGCDTIIQKFYTVNLDGTDLQEFPLTLNGNDSISQFDVDAEGNIFYISNQYNPKTEEYGQDIVKVGTDGLELARLDLYDVLKLDKESYFGKFVIDEKGDIIITGKDQVYFMDSNLKASGEVKLDTDYIIGLVLSKDGDVLCATQKYLEEECEGQISILDVENKKVKKTKKLNNVSWLINIIDGSGDYDFYYSDDSGIYGYEFAKDTSKKIIDYMESNLAFENSYGIIPLEDGLLLGIITDYESENYASSFVSYSKVDPSTIANKKIITYGALLVDDAVKRAAIAFNKENKQYQIEFKDYSIEDDPVAKMNADIIAGNVPDIIDLAKVPADQYISKGILEDLTPYFAKDLEISEEDIIPSLLEAIKVDGKLYYITPSFYLYSLVGKTADVGKGTGWTFDEFKLLVEKKGDGIRPFFYDNKQDMLNCLLGIGVGDFIDWKVGKCSFDNQDFKDILEICNECGVNEEFEWREGTPSREKMVKDGKVLFMEGYVDVDQIQICDTVFGEDYNFIGYPTKDKQGSYFGMTTQLALYAKSNVKEGAWEFLRTFMTKEYQGKTMDEYYTPSRQDCFDLMLEGEMSIKEYDNELGRHIYPRNGTMRLNDDFTLEMKPLTQKQADVYITLVKTTRKIGHFDDSITKIIGDEAKSYFAGAKSLESTIDVIQNRVTTYINEKR